MKSEALNGWLDAMPIDDVRRKIERLEAKLADLRVLERIHSDRTSAAPEAPDQESPQGWGEQHG